MNEKNISLSLEDNNQSNKQFSKKIISKSQNKKVNKSKLNQKTIHKPNKLTNTKYAIQISSWPTLKEARMHQLELLEAGFDAYIQRYYLQKKDEVWYRVRVGNFSNRKKAVSIKEAIETFTGITTWLDIINS